MKHLDAGGLVTLRDVDRIAVINFGCVSASLCQPHTVAALEIDRRDDEHQVVSAFRIVSITSGKSTAFVEIALPPLIVRRPCQSVNVPPASSMIGSSAAQSQIFMIGSSITSARPVATRTCP